MLNVIAPSSWPGKPCDYRVLDASIPQVVDERVTEAVERFTWIGDAPLRPPKPLRLCMAQFPTNGFQFREQLIRSGRSDSSDCRNMPKSMRADAAVAHGGCWSS